MTSTNPGNDEAYEESLAKWMIEQIAAFDAGTLEATKIGTLDQMIPTWRDDDSRVHFGLTDDWTEARMRTYLSRNLDSFDAGTMSCEHEHMLDVAMPDWRDDVARIFCGRTPLNWDD